MVYEGELVTEVSLLYMNMNTYNIRTIYIYLKFPVSPEWGCDKVILMTYNYIFSQISYFHRSLIEIQHM